jgi:ABC-type multidrug transport system fused ATPase/permease subunit
VCDRPGASALKVKGGLVEIEHLRFGYKPLEGGPIRLTLEDVNLVVPGGTTVALVGRSGAGKTTLASLIPRFYELTAGRI